MNWAPWVVTTVSSSSLWMGTCEAQGSDQRGMWGQGGMAFLSWNMAENL